ncbi:uncharacterized protein B0P05DRAFT_583727 [Gilbertella persicaria]|uniref:uncharacterized protein n=1 Tax=Gilbertella persicaria TaxID=101096 RepID=UPI00222101BC|nr:uncharacterized protein B0P05DRAFT_583727 [Gilbertella persicaria]KAI8091202.1 hypothetical protein B0P05DRAFT_583727 [Gilbertella persicaria]
MSFVNFPAALPFFKQLHDQASLDHLISQLGQDVCVKEIEELDLNKSHPFMDAYDKMANQKLTTNGAPAHASTMDPIIDCYYGFESVAPQGRPAMYENAWKSDPLMTLHIIFYARSIHRGKSLGSAFFFAYCWLLLNHPRTALANLHVLVDGTVRTDAELQHNRLMQRKNRHQEWDMVEEPYELLDRRDFKSHGCWKDLCTLLTIYCQGEAEGYKSSDFLALEWPRMQRDRNAHREISKERKQRYMARKHMSPEKRAKEIEASLQKRDQLNLVKQQEATELRHKIRVERNKTVCDLLESDKTYRALHFTIARMFAQQLKTDLKQLEANMALLENKKLSGRYALGFNLSLAAKWAPSLRNSHDKHTFLATSIAEILFPPVSFQDKDETRPHYLNKVRDLYRKKYLVPLRAALDLTEHYMKTGQWELADFRHMPSVCFQQNLKYFFKHCPDKTIAYMAEVAKGNKKVSGATLGPHELVHRCFSGGVDEKLQKALSGQTDMYEKFLEVQKQGVNGQWDTLINSIRDTSLLQDSSDTGKKRVNLGDCLAICDVSGSMMSGADPKHPEMQPLNAAIGLSLVVTNLAKPPFNGAVISFSANPVMSKVNTNATFSDQVQEIMEVDMGYNTNLMKVFTEVLLPMAKEHKIKPEDMVKRLFIFTDMEFDAMDNGMNAFVDANQAIRALYHEAGYEVPELIWWNLCSHSGYSSVKKMTTPVTKDDLKVTLISGFSSAMLKTFLDGDIEEEEEEENSEKQDKENKESSPISFIEKAIYHESFNSLVVVD